MSTEDNKAVTHRVFDGFNQTGVAIVDEFYTADFVLRDPGSPTQAGGVKSREDFKQYLTGFFAFLPGQFTIDDMIAEGDKVVTRWTYRSTHQGPVEGCITFQQRSDVHGYRHLPLHGWQSCRDLEKWGQPGRDATVGSDPSVRARSGRTFSQTGNSVVYNCRVGKCLGIWADFALKHEHLPPIVGSTTIDCLRNRSRGD